MSATIEARLGELDRVLDDQHPTSTLADELFAVVDVIDGQPALRRALTDPSTPQEARSGLVGAVFGERVSGGAQRVLVEAARRRWAGQRGLTTALERQGVRALLAAAQSEGRLDDVEDELFRFGRIVAGDAGLRQALGDRNVPAAARRDLVATLLAGKTQAVTLALAQRAIGARNRTYELTLAQYLKSAAALRGRTIAKVVVARPLDEAQSERLRQALSRQLGRDITLQVSVDPTVLGGVRVNVGDDVIEGTVERKLGDAQRHIS